MLSGCTFSDVLNVCAGLRLFVGWLQGKDFYIQQNVVIVWVVLLDLKGKDILGKQIFNKLSPLLKMME